MNIKKFKEDVRKIYNTTMVPNTQHTVTWIETTEDNTTIYYGGNPIGAALYCVKPKYPEIAIKEPWDLFRWSPESIEKVILNEYGFSAECQLAIARAFAGKPQGQLGLTLLQADQHVIGYSIGTELRTEFVLNKM